MEENDESFHRFWSKYENSIFSLCFMLLSQNKQDAQDAASLTYLKTKRGFISCLATEQMKKQWFLKVARNICYDQFRKRKREKKLLEDFAAVQEHQTPFGSIYKITPETQAIEKQNMLMIRNAITRLPKDLRDTMMRYSIYEHNYKTISKDMNISECNARKRIQLARNILRNTIS